MVSATLSAPAVRSTRRNARQSATRATQATAATHDNLMIIGTPDTSIGGDQIALSRDPSAVACRNRCRQARQAMRARQQSQPQSPDAAEIERKVLAWEAAVQKAHECYGEMNAYEERMMELMHKAGVKSVRLSDGRVVVVLDEFKDPCGATMTGADFIQVIPAGVIPE